VRKNENKNKRKKMDIEILRKEKNVTLTGKREKCGIKIEKE
jgi:hypothetical protein